jgi:hypothetical protein
MHALVSNHNIPYQSLPHLRHHLRTVRLNRPCYSAQSEDFQIRESQPNTTRSPVRSLLKKTDEYIKNKTDVNFKSANGSVPRRRALDRRNNVARLFSQAKLAFRWRGTSGKILPIRLPDSIDPVRLPMVTNGISITLWAC